jgi:diguanylate cyclase (GGDEF)-like protein
MSFRVAAFVGGIAAVALLCVLAPDTDAARVGYDLAIVVTTGITWYGSTRAGNDRMAWCLIAGGLTCWVVGDLLWDAYAYLRWDRPSVSVADLLYLAGYPLLAAGIVRILTLRTPGRYREGLLDGVAFAIAAAIATWAFLVVPTTQDASLLDAAVWGAYPFADVLIFAAVVWLVLTPGRRGAPTLLLLAFLTGTLVLDLLWTAIPLLDATFDPGPLNGGYPIAYAALALASILPDRGELTARTTLPLGRMHPARFMLLGFALMTAPTIAIATTSNMSLASEIFLFVASMTLASIVLWRFRIAVREREQVQAELEHQLAHDHLTGLYNRPEWVEILKLQLSRAVRTGTQVAVLYLDLDGFKPVNDTFGHSAGDFVLVAVAERLRLLVRPHDVVARVGGDEFAISCEDLQSIADAEEIAARIIAGLAVPVEVADPPAAQPVTVSVSVGITISGGDCPAERLVDDADGAMYRAKQAGKNRYALAPAPGIAPPPRGRPQYDPETGRMSRKEPAMDGRELTRQ